MSNAVVIVMYAMKKIIRRTKFDQICELNLVNPEARELNLRDSLNGARNDDRYFHGHSIRWYFWNLLGVLVHLNIRSKRPWLSKCSNPLRHR
jgi:hypothetical protein